VNTIVLVDDSADLRRLVRSRLTLSRAFDVVGEGADGTDAIELATAHRPDVLLLDVSMSGMDGLEAIPLVITASPSTKVVMFSGFDEQGLAERAVAMGASDFIEKSTPMPDVVDRLMAVCGAPPVARPLPTAADANDDLVMTEQVERFRAAFDEAAIGMATMTLTGRVVRANTSFEALVGAAGSLVGARYLDLTDDQHRTAVREAIGAVAAGTVDAENVVHAIVTPTGDRRVTSTIAAVRDSQRRPLYLLVQVQDITERQAAEEELRQSEERFRLLVEAVGDYAIFMLDPTGHISSWNLGAQRTKGYTADEVIGRHFELFYEEEARRRKHPQWELEQAIEHGRYEEEGWRLRKDGSRFWANVVITPVRDHDGVLIGFAKVTRDVTDRLRLTEERDRAAQQLEAAARERTEFLAVTAHELRGPVALLHGFSELLRDHWRELTDDERDDMSATLVQTSSRLRRLVEDLLMAARLESGAIEVHLERVQLAPLLGGVARELAPADETIAVHCPDDLVVVADPGRLQQVISNFVSNAVRYGEPPVAIDAVRDGFTVEIAVTDAGTVPEVLRDRLFDKFSHGDHAESTGLGLYIVQQLAVAQGGEARYESTSAGSRFVVTLTATDDAD
jgi:PAS domain S-box-containing protein